MKERNGTKLICALFEDVNVFLLMGTVPVLVRGVYDDVECGRTNFVDFQFHVFCRWGAESDSVDPRIGLSKVAMKVVRRE